MNKFVPLTSKCAILLVGLMILERLAAEIVMPGNLGYSALWLLGYVFLAAGIFESSQSAFWFGLLIALLHIGLAVGFTLVEIGYLSMHTWSELRSPELYFAHYSLSGVLGVALLITLLTPSTLQHLLSGKSPEVMIGGSRDKSSDNET
jgi:NADH:ubiquinone oxidoreductase subunit 6 (subunit J)